MEPILAALARFVAGTADDGIPVSARDHAALIVADTIGAILGGSREPEVGRLHADGERAAGPATALGAGFPRVEPWWAIVANGLAGTMLELDEGHRFARGHPGIHVLPAALAEAERLGRSGAALLTAVVVGYDVAARLGGAGPVRPGMHMHGVHGAVGAAAAVARLRELDGDVTARALGVAAGLTLGTSWRTRASRAPTAGSPWIWRSRASRPCPTC
jgi:2-methylcitrate dehydratase PrpD